MSDKQAMNDRQSMIAVAQRAATNVLQSLTGKDPEANVETDVRTLQSLAEIIGALLGEVNRCGGEDCMGRSENGVRLWITEDRLQIEKDRVDKAEASLSGFETALRMIADSTPFASSELGMLTDWQDVAGRMQNVARNALHARENMAATP